MSGEIDLISDGDGTAIIGDPAAVDLFLQSQGLPSRDLGFSRLRGALGTGGAIAQAGSQIAENSGRWVKLTKESAEILKKSRLMKGSTDGLKPCYRHGRKQDGAHPAARHQARDSADQSGAAYRGCWPHVPDGDAAGDGRDHGLPRRH